MHEDLKALSTREKEALQLLLAGHDAKSTARSLGLSVHTVNEHLRDARRKLGVSSSREAARLMAAGETTPPYYFGDKKIGAIVPAPNLFGDRQIGVAHSTHLQQTVNHWPVGFSLAWLVGGMLVMSVIMTALMLSLGMANASQAERVAPSPPAAPPVMMDLMPFADANRDGRVTPPEYRVFSEQGWGVVAKKKDQVNYASLDQSSQIAFLGVTPTVDGIITRRMYMDAVPARFKMLDRNGDGMLSSDELNGRSYQ